jgi:hypothetical protein
LKTNSAHRTSSPKAPLILTGTSRVQFRAEIVKRCEGDRLLSDLCGEARASSSLAGVLLEYEFLQHLTQIPILGVLHPPTIKAWDGCMPTYSTLYLRNCRLMSAYPNDALSSATLYSSMGPAR